MSSTEDPATNGDQASTSSSSAKDGQAPVSSQNPPQTQTQSSTDDRDKIIAELRKENASHRTKLSAFEKEKQEADLAKLGDLEKAQKRADLAETQLTQYRQQLATAHVKLAAQALGIIDPDLAALAIQSDLQFGDDGLPTNVEDLLKTLLKSKPYLAPPKTEPQAMPPTPAQTAQPQHTAPSQLPAMNPGRANITSPTTPPPTGKPPRLTDVWRRS